MDGDDCAAWLLMGGFVVGVALMVWVRCTSPSGVADARMDPHRATELEDGLRRLGSRLDLS